MRTSEKAAAELIRAAFGEKYQIDASAAPLSGGMSDIWPLKNQKICKITLLDTLVGQRGEVALEPCREMMVREVFLLNKLKNCQNIVLLFDYAFLRNKSKVLSSEADCALMIEEKLQTLESCFRNRPVDEALLHKLAAEIMTALKQMHSLQPPCNHRDVKKGNILWRPDPGVFVLADLGASRQAGSEHGTAFCPDKNGIYPPEQTHPSAVLGRQRMPASADLYMLSKTILLIADDYRVSLSDRFGTFLRSLAVDDLRKRPYQSAAEALAALSCLDHEASARNTAAAKDRIRELVSAGRNDCYQTPFSLLQELNDPRSQPLAVYLCLLQNKEPRPFSITSPQAQLVAALEQMLGTKACSLDRMQSQMLSIAKNARQPITKGAALYYAGRAAFYQNRKDKAVSLFQEAEKYGFRAARLALSKLYGQNISPQEYTAARRVLMVDALFPYN